MLKNYKIYWGPLIQPRLSNACHWKLETWTWMWKVSSGVFSMRSSEAACVVPIWSVWHFYHPALRVGLPLPATADPNVVRFAPLLAVMMSADPNKVKPWRKIIGIEGGGNQDEVKTLEAHSEPWAIPILCTKQSDSQMRDIIHCLIAWTLVLV